MATQSTLPVTHVHRKDSFVDARRRDFGAILESYHCWLLMNGGGFPSCLFTHPLHTLSLLRNAHGCYPNCWNCLRLGRRTHTSSASKQMRKCWWCRTGKSTFVFLTIQQKATRSWNSFRKTHRGSSSWLKVFCLVVVNSAFIQGRLYHNATEGCNKVTFGCTD